MADPPHTAPAPAAPADDDDRALLRRLTGQTEVSEPDHARALLAVARRAEADARDEHERTRRPLRSARFRMLPVTLRVPPLVAALVLSSAIIFALAMLLIAAHFVGLTVALIELVALISIGYTLGFGVILYLLIDAPGESDDNRAAVRRRQLQAAVDARVASAAKVMRLEAETRAREQLLQGVITWKLESARRRREEAAKAAKPKQPREKSHAPDARPANVPPANLPPKPDPTEPEYGGG